MTGILDQEESSKNQKIMKVYIKNMVCQGTRKFVLMEIKKLGLSLVSFESGEIEFQNDLSPLETSELEYKLRKYGLEMLSGKEVPAGNVSFGFMEPVIRRPGDEYLLDENEMDEITEPSLSTVN